VKASRRHFFAWNRTGIASGEEQNQAKSAAATIAAAAASVAWAAAAKARAGAPRTMAAAMTWRVPPVYHSMEGKYL